MAHTTWVLFLVVSLAAVLTPGPAMLAILGNALARGARATLPVVLGNVFGAVLLIGASVAGLSALLATVPHALTLLKWVGAAYLVWLGVRAWRAEGPAADEIQTRPPGGAARAFGRGVLIALSNPKALLFFGAVLPQFVDPARPAPPQFAIMAATFCGLELAVTSTVTLLAHLVLPLWDRAALTRRVSRAGGAVMVVAATVLLLAPTA